MTDSQKYPDFTSSRDNAETGEWDENLSERESLFNPVQDVLPFPTLRSNPSGLKDVIYVSMDGSSLDKLGVEDATQGAVSRLLSKNETVMNSKNLSNSIMFEERLQRRMRLFFGLSFLSFGASFATLLMLFI
eukprot:maker-scaffold_4-snap-gene-3.0-mRNA-1 protein AED:0.00 eAED:0.00 QI:187/1/1/1/0/0/2/61/131